MDPKKVARIVLPKTALPLAEESYRRGRLWLAQALYGFPARDTRVIAVTGTNGKTTTCMMINSILKSSGYKTAMYTTAVIEVAGKAEPNLRHTTVPLTTDLLRFFRSARRAEVDFVVIEVTSHALHQHKLRGIPIEVAVMTNFTQDHLDYHGTMERYAQAKARLFNNYMQPNYCVLNADDEWHDYFLKHSVGVCSNYGQKKDCEVVIRKVQLSGDGTDFELGIEHTKTPVHLQLTGEFNVYNATAAAAAATALGLTPAKIAKGLAAMPAVPGRMERVSAGQNFTVLVDYAYTPDALAKVLQAARLISKGKVILVFGATGDRDKSKRPQMGEVAAKQADRIFLTDDETYTENPAEIRESVMAGIKKGRGQKKTTEVADRRKAIKAAFTEAKKGDIVLLTGLGHQNYRNMGGKKQPWDERVVAKQLLKDKD